MTTRPRTADATQERKETPMPMTRRAAIIALGSAAMAAAAAPARALSTDAAESFVRSIIDEAQRIVNAATPADARVGEFLTLFRRVAALPEIGRFTVGLAWREMSEKQRADFLSAFERYAARAYSARIGDYQGQTMTVDGAQDAGRRGVLVRSTLSQQGAAPIRVEWLVSDRTGEPKVIDIIAEGVSISITQREEFAAMLERRGRDIDRFIADIAGDA
jgi:phospholipid transport system substrate-binding protein